MSIIKHLLNGGVRGRLRDRFVPLTGLEKLLPSAVFDGREAVFEPSIINDGDSVKIYFTNTLTLGQASVAMATATNVDSDWTIHPTPIAGLGYGGAPSDRQANCSFAFKANGFYYLMATNGYDADGSTGDKQVYLYKSTDGVNFIDLGVIFQNSLIPNSNGYGNTSIYPQLVNGKYEILTESKVNGLYEIHRLNSTSIESGWQYVNKLSGLQVNSVGMYGGPWHTYFNNKWWVAYHYSPNQYTPTYLAWAVSDDLETFNIKESPMFGIETTPYGSATDQIADPFIVESQGKCFMLAEYNRNNPFYAQLWLWSFDGEFEQLVENT